MPDPDDDCITWYLYNGPGKITKNVIVGYVSMYVAQHGVDSVSAVCIHKDDVDPNLPKRVSCSCLEDKQDPLVPIEFSREAPVQSVGIKTLDTSGT